MNSTIRICLYVATLSATKSWISVWVASTSGLSVTKAFGNSPASSSGIPITATSATAGWEIISASNSAGGTWKRLIESLACGHGTDCPRLPESSDSSGDLLRHGPASFPILELGAALPQQISDGFRIYRTLLPGTLRVDIK